MHWTHFEEPATIFALAAQPNGKCLAATEQGLWQLNTPPPPTGTFRLKGGQAHSPSGGTSSERSAGEVRGDWIQIAPQFAQVPLSSVAAHGDTICIGASGDIAVSRDAGNTWALATLPVKAHILALALSPAFDQDHIGLAATAQDGVLRTADGGATWHAWNYGLLDLTINAIALSPDFANDATCFAATDHGVFTSSNGGRAWTELPIGMEHGPFTSASVVETRSLRDVPRIASLQIGTEGNGLWMAKEPFDTWQPTKGIRADEINYLLPNITATTKGVFVAEGRKWTKSLDEGDGVCLAQLDDGMLIVGTAGNGLWHGHN